eukprot:12471427-Heterocapsa_arctica.AAC.1
MYDHIRSHFLWHIHVASSVATWLKPRRQRDTRVRTRVADHRQKIARPARHRPAARAWFSESFHIETKSVLTAQPLCLAEDITTLGRRTLHTACGPQTQVISRISEHC